MRKTHKQREGRQTVTETETETESLTGTHMIHENIIYLLHMHESACGDYLHSDP